MTDKSETRSFFPIYTDEEYERITEAKKELKRIVLADMESVLGKPLRWLDDLLARLRFQIERKTDE